MGGDGFAWYACPALVSLPTALLHLCIKGDFRFDVNTASTKRDTDLLDRAKLQWADTRGHKSQEPRSFAPRSEAPRGFVSQGSFGGGKPGAFDARMLCHLGAYPFPSWVRPEPGTPVFCPHLPIAVGCYQVSGKGKVKAKARA